jgi:Tfp pilus assembly protein PilN
MKSVVKSLLVEVTRSIEAYRADDREGSITHAVIGGATGVEESLAHAMKDRFGFSTELFNPAAVCGWDPDRGAAASGFAAALGLVLGQVVASAQRFDFLHPKRVVTAAEVQLKKLPLVAAVVVLFLLSGVVGYFRVVKPQRDRLAAVEQEIEDAEREIAATKKFVKRIKQVEENEEAQLVWLDELHDLLSLLPSNEELVLESIDMSQEDGEVVLKAKATSREVLTETVNELKEYRLAGSDEPYYSASLGSTREETRGQYLWKGPITVRVVGSRPRPDFEVADRTKAGSKRKAGRSAGKR